MLIKKIASWSLLSLSVILLNACASSEPPEWFEQNIQDTNSDYIVLSHGLTMYDAKQKGLVEITQKLSTQVDTTVKIRNAGVAINLDGQESTRTYGYTDISINSKSANLSLNGIETLASAENDSGAYVKLKIAKASVKLQMENELQQYEQKAQAEIEALRYQDSLEWWIKNRHIEEFVAQVNTRISILATVNPNKRYSAPITQSYANTVSRVKNDILIFISAKSVDTLIAQYVADVLSQQMLATTSVDRANATHRIELLSSYDTNKIGKYYRYTAKTKIAVKSRKRNKTIANSSIVSIGSSPNSLKMAKIGAAQDFSKQIQDDGLWKFLGFSVK
jgi:hypothetical protein